MRVLTIEECEQVEGGFLAAILAFVAVFTLPKIINDHAQEYIGWGPAVGEAAWEYQHPYDPNK